MYRLTDDLWTGSQIGPVSPGRDGQFMETTDKSPRAGEDCRSIGETPFLYRRRRRRARRAV